ncbi:Uncharacterised protein, partial [Metamycoplasma alkalescens]
MSIFFSIFLITNKIGSANNAKPTAGNTRYIQLSAPDDTTKDDIAIANGTKKIKEFLFSALNLKISKQATNVCNVAIRIATGNKSSHLAKFLVVGIIQPSFPINKNKINEGIAIKNKLVKAVFHESERVLFSFLISKLW